LKVSCREIYEFFKKEKCRNVSIQGDDTVCMEGFSALSNPRNSCVT
jgi:hypothetical protein